MGHGALDPHDGLQVADPFNGALHPVAVQADAQPHGIQAALGECRGKADRRRAVTDMAHAGTDALSLQGVADSAVAGVLGHGQAVGAAHFGVEILVRAGKMGVEAVQNESALVFFGVGSGVLPQVADGGHGLGDLVFGMGREADAIHARVQGHVPLDGDLCLSCGSQQAGGVFCREQGSSDAVDGQKGDVSRVAVAQHEDVGLPVGGRSRRQLPQKLAKRYGLLQASHGEGAASRLQKSRYHGTDAVAVGVGLHHRYGVGLGRDGQDRSHEGVIVMGQRRGVDDGSCAGMGQEGEALVELNVIHG